MPEYELDIKQALTIQKILDNWVWYLSCLLLTGSILFYILTNISPLREYLVLASLAFVIIVAMFKFIK